MLPLHDALLHHLWGLKMSIEIQYYVKPDDLSPPGWNVEAANGELCSSFLSHEDALEAVIYLVKEDRRCLNHRN